MQLPLPTPYRRDLPDFINQLRQRWVDLIRETKKASLGYDMDFYLKCRAKEMAVFVELAVFSFRSKKNVFKDLEYEINDGIIDKDKNEDT